MGTQTIFMKAGQLSEELQREVLDYIEFLLSKYNHQNRQDTNLSRRQDVVRRIDVVWERLFAKYGEMSDSVELIREDRAR